MMRAIFAFVLLASCGSPHDAHQAAYDRVGGFVSPGGAFVPPTKGGGGGGTGTVTSVGCGTGMTGGTITTTGTCAVNPTAVQSRVSSIPCAAGSYLTSIAQGGAATCTVAVNAAGTGLTLTGSSLAVDPTVVQSRVSGTAATHNAITAIAQGGTVTTAAFLDSSSFPTTTCTTGKVITAIAVDGTATCTSPGQNDYTGTHLEWSDEFMGGAVTSNVNQQLAGGALFWTNAGTASGVVAVGSTLRPGVVQATTGTTTTGRAAFNSGSSSIDFGSGVWTFEWVGGVDALSIVAQEYTLIAGFADTLNVANQTDGCFFLYDRLNVSTSGGNSGNADKWECACANSNARTFFLMDGSTVSSESFTTVNTPVAAVTLPNTGMLRMKVVVTQSIPRAEFYVDSGSGYTKRCDINTNIPSGAARVTGVLVQMLKSAGTTATTYENDQVRFAVDLTAARSP